MQLLNSGVCFIYLTQNEGGKIAVHQRLYSEKKVTSW